VIMLASVRPRRRCIAMLALVLLPLAAAAAPAKQNGSIATAPFDPLEATIPELQVALGVGRTTSVALVDYYLARIEALDDDGPGLNAIAAVNPNARQRAAVLDLERREGRLRGPLHGIPLVVKDNFETRGIPTTAGSALLSGFQPDRDASVVRRLREAGAIVLAKTNMHEFAYGITSVGSGFGEVRNPYDPRRTPGGSSGGSAAAVAANMAAAGLGTDTCGSVRIPAAFNSLVGLRATQGLISRRGIVPLSHTQDIAGPLTRSVVDAALLLDAMATVDDGDPQTADGYRQRPDSYLDALRPGALRGARIGLLEDALLVEPEDAAVADVVGAAANRMQALGATVVRVSLPDLWPTLESRLSGFFVLVYDFKQDINAYLAEQAQVPVRSLTEIIAAGVHHPGVDSSLRASEAMASGSRRDYLSELAHRDEVRRYLLAVMARERLDALVYPTIRREPVRLGQDQPGSNCLLSANSGLPALVVPAGFTARGLPAGMELLGAPWSEPVLLGLAYDYEQAVRPRRPPGGELR
jgi:amidase